MDLCLYDKSKNVLVTDMLHSMGLSLNLNFYVHWDNMKVPGRPHQQERNRITELEEALQTSESMLESDGMECEASEVGYRFLEKKSDNDTTMPPPVRAMLCEEAKNDCGSLQNIISFDSFRCPICMCSKMFESITSLESFTRTPQIQVRYIVPHSKVWCVIS